MSLITGLGEISLPRQKNVFTWIQDSFGFVLFINVFKIFWKQSQNFETNLANRVPLAFKPTQEQFKHF